MKRFIFIIFIFGCYSEKLLTPKTTIIEGPEYGEILNNNLVKFVWSGDGCNYYQYSIDNDLSNWTTDESISLILDDGYHEFWVKGKNILEEKEKDFPYLKFFVDGVRNGFSVFPIFDSITLSQEINVTLRGENLRNHTFEYIKFVWDKEINLLEYRIDSTIFYGNSIPVIIVKEYPCSLEIYRTNLEGFPQQDIIVGNFKFSANVKGVYNFSIKDAKIFDSLGVEIPFDTLNGGKIVVY